MNASDVTSRARGMVGLASRGQTTAEYAIVIGVVAAALIGMQVYLKRSAQMKLKVGVDEFTQSGGANVPWLAGDVALQGGRSVSGDVTAGDVRLTKTTSQYEPYYTESDFNTKRVSTVDEDVDLSPGNERIIKTIQPNNDETQRKAGGYQKQRSWSEAQ